MEARTATTTTRMAPIPRARNKVLGRISIPIRARTTVSPEKNTALVAVAPARSMATSFSNPWPRSSL